MCISQRDANMMKWDDLQYSRQDINFKSNSVTSGVFHIHKSDLDLLFTNNGKSTGRQGNKLDDEVKRLADINPDDAGGGGEVFLLPRFSVIIEEV